MTGLIVYLVLLFWVTWYCSLRLMEMWCIAHLPSTSKLYDWPLPKLYRYCLRVERSRLRTARMRIPKRHVGTRTGMALNDFMKIQAMRVIGRRQSRAYLGARIEQTFARAMMGIDAVVDDDVAPMRGTREGLFEFVTRMVEGLERPAELHEQALPEILALVYTVRACQQWLRLDPVPQLQAVWRDYTPDAKRILAGEMVTDLATMRQAERAYTELMVLMGLVLGLDHASACRLAELDTPGSLEHDRLVDLLRDARKRQLQIASERLEAWGINPYEICLHATSREDLATVPGLAAWCVHQAETALAQWRQALPELLVILSQVQPKWIRGAFRRTYQRRERSFERCLAFWQQYV